MPTSRASARGGRSGRGGRGGQLGPPTAIPTAGRGGGALQLIATKKEQLRATIDALPLTSAQRQVAEATLNDVVITAPAEASRPVPRMDKTSELSKLDKINQRRKTLVAADFSQSIEMFTLSNETGTISRQHLVTFAKEFNAIAVDLGHTLQDLMRRSVEGILLQNGVLNAKLKSLYKLPGAEDASETSFQTSSLDCDFSLMRNSLNSGSAMFQEDEDDEFGTLWHIPGLSIVKPPPDMRVNCLRNWASPLEEESEYKDELLQSLYSYML